MGRYFPVMESVRAYRALGEDWVVYVGWRLPWASTAEYGPAVLPALMEIVDAAVSRQCNYVEK
jgi:hypothetical protein